MKVKNLLINVCNRIKNRAKEISVIRYIKTNILFITYVVINLINS